MGSRGQVDPGFEGVRKQFEKNLEKRGEHGGALTIHVRGRRVVDLWGGVVDEVGTPWEQDSLVCCYSVTKGLVALCVNLLADRGELDLDRRVADVWPSFGQAGKQEIAIASLLRHEAGLIGPREVLGYPESHDWERVCDALAASEPWWRPGTRQGYHALTFGHLAGELVRRTTGQTVGRFLADEVAGPLGADVHIGTDDDRVLDRCGDILGSSSLTEDAEPNPDVPEPPVADLDQHRFAPLVVALQHLRFDEVNSAAFRRAELPSVNLHATARGLATIYDALLDGRLLSEQGLHRASAPSEMPDNWDVVLSPASSLPAPRHRWGLGFQVSAGEMFGPAAGAFGHGGASGAMAFADPTHGIAFAYTTNTFQQKAPPTRQRLLRLIEATYRAMGLSNLNGRQVWSAATRAMRRGRRTGLTANG